MNETKTLFLTILTFFVLGNLSFAQDLHFTNNIIVPTLFNPAQTGAYVGNIRAGLIYRDQWRPQISTPYQEAMIFVDSPVMFGFTKQHWVGVGATLFSDKAGAPGQMWSGFYPGVSYHIGFDKKFRNVFTVGVQYGFAKRDYNYEGWVSEDETLLSVTSPDRGIIKDLKASYSDLNVGLLFKSKIDKYSRFEIGASFIHALSPSFKFSGTGGKNEIGQRINFHTLYRRAISAQMIWEPSLYFSQMPNVSNIQIQLRNEYLLKKKGDFAIITGIGYRIGDALQLLTGARYKDWLFSLSYDQGVSGLGGELVGSAFELGAQKRFIINKKPKVKPIIYCPRL
ncbi:MAG: PorP/SprF family type IX secretion system membrane protein [Saprospiraceae bacterium]